MSDILMNVKIQYLIYLVV